MHREHTVRQSPLPISFFEKDLKPLELSVAPTLTTEQVRAVEVEYKKLYSLLLDSIAMSYDGGQTYHHHYNDNILANSGKIAGAKVCSWNPLN